MATILPDWPFSAMVLGLGLVHSLLFMVLLVFVDPHIYAWMVDSLKPKSPRRRIRQRLAISPEAAAALDQTLTPIKIGNQIT